MKKLLVWLIVLTMAFTCVPISFAASEEAIQAANDLHNLGLFNGVGNNADGTPNFDLDRTMTRAEAVTMLVRLLGKESEAKKKSWDMPFTDVADWAKPYVGYAYANKLTNGTGATTFSGTDKVSATQYLTFVLRALGYDSSIDFQWDKAWELTDRLGITAGEYYPNCKFERGDAVIVSASALFSKMKNQNVILLDTLVSTGAVTDSSAEYFKNVAEFRDSKIERLEEAGGIFIIDGKYYSLQNKPPLFWAVQTGKHGTKRYFFHRSYLGCLLAVLTNNYTIGKNNSDNPYLSGTIQVNEHTKRSVVDVDGISVECSGYDDYLFGVHGPIYTSINTSDWLFVYKNNKATFSFYDSGLKKNEVVAINGVRVASIDLRQYICIDDLVKYMGINASDYEVLEPGSEVSGIKVL